MKELTLPTGYAAPCREPHCGVLAVAICADVPLETAFETIKQAAGYNGNWKGRTYLKDRTGALDTFGAYFTVTRHAPRRVLQAHNWPEGWAPTCTLATFAKRHAKPGVTYMIDVSGHTFTLRNGMIADQSGVRPYGASRLARCTIRSSTEIR